MAKEEAKQTITVDIDTLNQLIEARVAKQLVDLQGGKDPDERMHRAMAEARGTDRPPMPEDRHACQSPITGATFTARVLKSRSFPNGRVVELLDYKDPEGLTVHQNEGGLVPDGMEMRRPDGKINPDYRHWKVKNFWHKDLEAMISKPFQRFYLATEYQRRADEDKAAEK